LFTHRCASLSINVELTVKTLETPLTEASLKLALKPTLAAKQYGSEDLLASLVSEAVLAVMPKNPTAVSRNFTLSVRTWRSLMDSCIFLQFNVDNVRVVKIMGGGLSQSRVIRGMVFGREPEGKLTLSLDLLSSPFSFLDYRDFNRISG